MFHCVGSLDQRWPTEIAFDPDCISVCVSGFTATNLASELSVCISGLQQCVCVCEGARGGGHNVSLYVVDGAITV